MTIQDDILRDLRSNKNYRSAQYDSGFGVYHEPGLKIDSLPGVSPITLLDNQALIGLRTSPMTDPHGNVDVILAEKNEQGPWTVKDRLGTVQG